MNCNFEIEDSAIGTYDDNGSAQCFICKHWHECREKEILEEMLDFENSFNFEFKEN